MVTRVVIAMVLVLAWCGVAAAHPAVPTVAMVKIEMGGHVRVIIVHDALAYALNDTSTRIGDAEMYALLNGPRRDIAEALIDGRERMEAGFELSADKARVACTLIRWPDMEAVDHWKAANPGLGLPVKLEFEFGAALPASARSVSMRFPVVLDTVLLVVDRPGVEPVAIPLSPGEVSPGIDVGMALRRDATGAAKSEIAGAAGEGSGDAGGSQAAEPSSSAGSDPLGFWATAFRYVVLGYEHVVPEGADHALFVLGLFLLSPRVKSVVWQITAFTVAHSLTLTLAALHLVSVPASVVEPTIALTIAFIAVENLFVKKVRPWRVGVAFLFGLVHGLGFASALSEVGLPTGQLVAGLVAFNVGVEGGHLTVLLAALLVLGWCRDKRWYRGWVAVPISLVIAGLALYWAVERIWGGG